jgi:hypothetical protein
MAVFLEQPDIVRGADCAVAYDIPLVCFGGLDPLTCRILVHFKISPEQTTPTAIIDSAITPLAVLRTLLVDPHPHAGDINITLKLTSAQTATFLKGEILYDIFAINGAVKVLIAGKFGHPIYVPITVPS